MSKPKFINVDFNRLEQKSYKTLNPFEKEIIDKMVEISLEKTQNEAGIRKELIEAMMDCVEKLPVQQRKVLTWLYGLDGSPVLKEEAIAKKLGIKQPSVSNLKKRAESQLQKKLNEFIEKNF
jgi:RNA polymerase sigma factor (sigma-70 family)